MTRVPVSWYINCNPGTRATDTPAWLMRITYRCLTIYNFNYYRVHYIPHFVTFERLY